MDINVNQPHTKILPNNLISSYVGEIFGDHQCGFPCKNELLLSYSAFVRYWRRNGSILGHYISYL